MIALFLQRLHNYPFNLADITVAKCVKIREKGCDKSIVTAFINTTNKFCIKKKHFQVLSEQENKNSNQHKSQTTNLSPMNPKKNPSWLSYCREFIAQIKTTGIFRRSHRHVRGREKQLGNAGKVGKQEEDAPDSRVPAQGRAGDKWSFRAGVSVVSVFRAWTCVHV